MQKHGNTASIFSSIPSQETETSFLEIGRFGFITWEAFDSKAVETESAKNTLWA